MNQLEDLVRAAQEVQAERAVPVDRVRAALPALARRRRRQRRGAVASIVAAVAVAVAVAVPVLLARPSAQAPVAPRFTTGSVPVTFALDYGPGWTPPGYAETDRQLTGPDPDKPTALPGRSVLRVWTKQGPGAGTASAIRLTVYPEAPFPHSEPGHSWPVDINGRTGAYVVDSSNGAQVLDWRPAANVSISLMAEGPDVATSSLVRMARSVRPDAALNKVPVRLPWGPTGMVATVVDTSGSSLADWGAQITLAGQGRRITVSYAAYPQAPTDGDFYFVGGHAARRPVATDPAHRNLVYLVLDMDNGHYLTFEGSAVTFDALTEVASSARIDPSGLGWLKS